MLPKPGEVQALTSFSVITGTRAASVFACVGSVYNLVQVGSEPPLDFLQLLRGGRPLVSDPVDFRLICENSRA